MQQPDGSSARGKLQLRWRLQGASSLITASHECTDATLHSVAARVLRRTQRAAHTDQDTRQVLGHKTRICFLVFASSCGGPVRTRPYLTLHPMPDEAVAASYGHTLRSKLVNASGAALVNQLKVGCLLGRLACLNVSGASVRCAPVFSEVQHPRFCYVINRES